MLLRLVLAVAVVVPFALPAFGAGSTVILATTTSTQDSGLLDVLVPAFERKTGQSVKTIAVGTGQALALAARGEADVVLAHAPSLEKTQVAEGKLRNRRLVMYNDFVIVGPADDPARVRGREAADAMRRVAEHGARFVSRGDRSGTHLLELALWQEAAVTPAGRWYIEAGQGMGVTLGIANDRRGYTLTDRATYLAFQRRIALPILVQGDRRLRNVYAVLEVDPANGARVNAAGGKAFADFLLGTQAQAIITAFGVDHYGQALFVPLAGSQGEDGPR